MKDFKCIYCGNNDMYVEGGVNNASTDNMFTITCLGCNCTSYLTPEEADIEYGKQEFEDFLKLLGSKRLTVETLKMLSNHGFDGYAYYEGEGGGHETHGLNEEHGTIDPKYDDVNIDYISIYGTWIHINITGDSEEPIGYSLPYYEMREY